MHKANYLITEKETKKQYSLKEFLRQIDLNKQKLKKIESLLYGTFQSYKYGGGFDFNEIREYKIGDDLRHISWSTTAKTGTLHTKEYFTEKEIRTFFLIDVSTSMFCGNKLGTFIKTVAFLLNLSCQFSEKIGGLFFTNEITSHFGLSQSNYEANLIFNSLIHITSNLTKEIPLKSTFTDLNKALDFSNNYFHKKGLLLIISDFTNIKGWEKTIYNTAKKHIIYSFQIFDPVDFNIPLSGYLTLFDPETKKRIFVNTDNILIKDKYKNIIIEKQQYLTSFFHKIGAHHFVIEKADFN